MISFKELINDTNVSDIAISVQHNLEDLLAKLNKFRAAYGKPMIVTSGLRSMQDHLRIYRSKGISDDKIPMKSKHLFGQACDFADPDGKLYAFAVKNKKLLEECDLYFEKETKGWLHLQSVPFGSYKPGGDRGFYP